MILVKDAVPALHVSTPEMNRFQRLPSQSFIVNIANSLICWTKDLFHSTVQRAINIPVRGDSGPVIGRNGRAEISPLKTMRGRKDRRDIKSAQGSISLGGVIGLRGVRVKLRPWPFEEEQKISDPPALRCFDLNHCEHRNLSRSFIGGVESCG
jgi:hypothetical protein